MFAITHFSDGDADSLNARSCCGRQAARALPTLSYAVAVVMLPGIQSPIRPDGFPQRQYTRWHLGAATLVISRGPSQAQDDEIRHLDSEDRRCEYLIDQGYSFASEYVMLILAISQKHRNQKVPLTGRAERASDRSSPGESSLYSSPFSRSRPLIVLASYGMQVGAHSVSIPHRPPY